MNEPQAPLTGLPMRHRRPQRWINLLLALLLAIGPLPVLAGGLVPSDCCSQPGAMSAVADMDCDEAGGNGACDRSADHGNCPPDHGCQNGHSPLGSFLLSSGPALLTVLRDGFTPHVSRFLPVGLSTPPTPPPRV